MSVIGSLLAACGDIPHGSQAYAFTGADQYFVVPAGAWKVRVYKWGAAAAGHFSNSAYTGGNGGYVEGDLAVTPGETLTVIVGQGGSVTQVSVGAYGGGGRGGEAGTLGRHNGGGRSAIRRGATELATAAAGGARKGHGGGTTGTDGYGTGHGYGGTPTAGGAPGSGAVAGTQYQGGDGGLTSYGGGGGGGWYGGGGGNSDGGGGGGSSYAGGLTNATVTAGTDSGPPNTGSPYYVAGIGQQVPLASGGNGRVVIVW